MVPSPCLSVEYQPPCSLSAAVLIAQAATLLCPLDSGQNLPIPALPRNAEVFTALAIWETFSAEKREVLRPCMFLLAEQQYTWGYAIVTVTLNAEYFERIGADPAWAAGVR